MDNFIFGLVAFIVSTFGVIVTRKNYHWYKKEEEDSEFGDLSYGRLMSLGRMIFSYLVMLLGLILIYNSIADYYHWSKIILP